MDAIILGNQDVLLKVMEFLGPRHVCIGLGATSRNFQRLSRGDSLWRVFWRDRCRYGPTGSDGDDGGGADGAGVGDVHKAALTFRHAIHEMGLADKLLCSSATRTKSGAANTKGKSEELAEAECDTGLTLYHAYVQKHSSMKLTNLRVEPFGHRFETDDELERCNLKSPQCTQTWPGQLSLVAVDDLPMRHRQSNSRVTCLNSAEAWCDYPGCTNARCGPEGCLRCYRFLPREFSHSRGAVRVYRECSRRDYDLVSFVTKCSWCSVSYCNEHVGVSGSRNRRRSHSNTASWYKCDECNLSSCPDCVSQVFLSPPEARGCGVITAGEACSTNICKRCTWYVGKKRQCRRDGNVPGGDYSKIQDEDDGIVTVKGDGTDSKVRMEFEEVETCCSKCLRHVEFRWKELSQVQESFGGFMP